MSVNHRDPITGVLTQLAGNGAPTDVGTAAFKDFTDVVRTGDHRLVEANAVANAIDQGLSSIYTPRGDIACAELTSSLLIEANIGNVYETSDAGTTSALFLQGADHPITKGDNVGIIKAGQNAIMFNLMGNAFDLHDYQKKELESAIEGATTVEGALGALSANKATQAEVNNIIRYYEYTSSNVPTKASFLILLNSSDAHMDFKFINATTDYMPNSSPYWYVQKFGGTDALHVRLLATDWVSGDLYTGDANATNNTITWWRLSGTQV